MIFEGILNAFKAVAIFIINLLPTFPDYSSIITTSLSPLFDMLHSICRFIDFKVWGACIIAFVIMTNIDFIFAVIMWIVKKIPGVS